MTYTPVELTNGTETRVTRDASDEASLRWEGWYPTGTSQPVLVFDDKVRDLIEDVNSVTRGALTALLEARVSRDGATAGQVPILQADGTLAFGTVSAGGGTVPDATDTVKGIIQLAGDLGGTAAAPTVPGLAGKAATVHTHDDRYYTEAEVDGAITAASTADRARANHTGTQPAATLSDLTEAVQDVVGAFLVAGAGVTVTYDDVANTFTINATGGGTTDPEIVRDVIGTALVGGAGIQITVNDVGDSITIASTAVLPTRQVNSGTGLSGGGDLSVDRTLAVAYGSTAGTAVQGNDTRVTADQAAATASIRTLGTGAQQAAAGNHGHAAAAITDSTATGRSLLTAADAAAARSTLSVLPDEVVTQAAYDAGPKTAGRVYLIVG